MPKDSFLFVPYHTGQQSLADIKIANSDARSHAAAVSRQRRDNKRLKAHLSTSSPAKAEAANERVPLTPDSDNTLDDAHQSASSLEGSHSPSSDVVLSKNKVQRRQHMRAMQFSWRAGNVSAELRLCNGFRADPFGHMPTSDFGRSVIDYFWRVISPVNSPIYAIFNVTNIYTSYWMELMQDEDYKPAGLAMVGSIMQRMAQPQCAPSQDVMSCQASAIARLQKKYSSAVHAGQQVVDDMCIITVLALASLSRFLGDLDAYQKHRNNLREMVNSRGGVDQLGHNGLAKCVILQWDSFWVFETAGTPFFSEARTEHEPVYPVFPLSADLRETFMELPAGFQLLVLKGKLSVELIEVLGRATDANSNGPQGLSPDNTNQSRLRKYHDFVEACPSLATSDRFKNSFEKDISLAILLYCFNAFTSPRSSTSLYAGARTELTRILHQEDEKLYSPPEQECLYWICAVCVDSWRQGGPGSALSAAGEGLLPVMKRMRNGFTSTNTLQRFLYNEELLQVSEDYLSIAG